MSEQPQVNEAEARTETGELKSQTPQSESTTTTQQNPEEKASTAQTETSTEKKVEGEQKAETKAVGAPEKYTDFKLPEGIELKPDALASAQELFKGLGLTQAAAQSLVDFHTTQMVANATAAATSPDTAYNEMRTEWKTKSEADPDIGVFTGSKALGMKENIGRALDALNDKQLKTDFQFAMDLTGLGDNPAFIKVANKWAQFVIEGRNVRPGGPSEHGQNDKGQTQRPSVAQGMYPNLKP